MIIGSSQQLILLSPLAICGFSDPPTCSGGNIPCCKTRNRGKRESTAFDLILRSAWGLSSPCKQVGRSSTPCQKRSKVKAIHLAHLTVSQKGNLKNLSPGFLLA